MECLPDKMAFWNLNGNHSFVNKMNETVEEDLEVGEEEVVVEVEHCNLQMDAVPCKIQHNHIQNLAID